MANAVATPIPHGLACDFGSVGHSATWYQALRAAGYDAVFLDIMSGPAWVQDYAYALAAGLGVSLFQGYWSPAWADPSQATARAHMMIDAARQVALPSKVCCALDLEAVPSSIGATAIAQWINQWSRLVAQAGWTAALYVGANQPLSGIDLYEQLPYIHAYWRSCSQVPDVAHRGFQVVQTACGRTFGGVAIDEDRIQPDLLGGRWIAARDPEAPWTLTTVTQQLTELQSAHQALAQKVAALETAQQAAARALGGS